MLDEINYELINDNLWMIELINNLSRELKRCCDCSFLYLYQDILPDAFENIYSDAPKRIYYFATAINDIEKPLYYIKYKEKNENGIIKKLRKKIIDYFENIFLKKVANEIEGELREEIHKFDIEILDSGNSHKNYNPFFNIKNFRLFDKVIDVRKYIKEELNLRFYKLTTLNLKNDQIYREMRFLAKSKYNLELHEAFLPNKNLDQGIDLLDITKNLLSFSCNYTYNFHSQQYIELVNDSSYINVIGVNQIVRSLYTHGKGIINSVINKDFEFISKKVGELIKTFFNGDILNMLKEERNYWEKNKSELNHNYPFKNAMNLRNKILHNDDKHISGIIIKIFFTLP